MTRYLAIALVLVAASSSVQAAEKKPDRTFTVAPGGNLTVDADGASVEVSVSDGNQVTIWLGGIRVLQDERRGARSVASAWAGVLAAGDAEARFDDLRIEAAPDRRRR